MLEIIFIMFLLSLVNWILSAKCIFYSNSRIDIHAFESKAFPVTVFQSFGYEKLRFQGTCGATYEYTKDITCLNIKMLDRTNLPAWFQSLLDQLIRFARSLVSIKASILLIIIKQVKWWKDLKSVFKWRQCPGRH